MPEKVMMMMMPITKEAKAKRCHHWMSTQESQVWRIIPKENFDEGDDHDDDDDDDDDDYQEEASRRQQRNLQGSRAQSLQLGRAVEVEAGMIVFSSGMDGELIVMMVTMAVTMTMAMIVMLLSGTDGCQRKHLSWLRMERRSRSCSIQTNFRTPRPPGEERMKLRRGNSYLPTCQIILDMYNCEKYWHVSTNRESEVAAFVWDGSKLVPTDARTLAKRSDLTLWPVWPFWPVLVQVPGPFWLLGWSCDCSLVDAKEREMWPNQLVSWNISPRNSWQSQD